MPARIASQETKAHLIPAACCGFLILTAGLSATTQYLAWSYRFAPILGAPWLRRWRAHHQARHDRATPATSTFRA